MSIPRRTLTLLRRLTNQVGATADETVRALAASWSQAWDELSPAWQQGITALLDEYRRTGRWPAPWQTARIEAIAAAQDRTERTLATLTVEAVARTHTAAAEVSSATLRAELDVIGSQRAGLDVAGASRTSAARELSARQARLTDLHRPIADTSASSMRRVLSRPPRAGAEPEAQMLYQQLRAGFNTGAVRAATIARTEIPDTYRTTAGLVHQANTQILTGWCWTCACDHGSCIACWSMHGRVFPLDAPGPAGHGGCRCTRLAVVEGVSLPTAEARFRRLTRRQQIAILGPTRFELWRQGRIPWSALASRRSNKGWRDSMVPTSVAHLQLLADRKAT